MILGVDPGERRVGVAVGDPRTGFAHPLEAIDAKKTDPVARVAAIAGEKGATTIVVGRPVGLSGRAGPAMDAQRDFVARLRAATDVEVTEHDERLTTVVAEGALRAAGARAGKRRALRDAVAAQVMLQSYMDGSA